MWALVPQKNTQSEVENTTTAVLEMLLSASNCESKTHFNVLKTHVEQLEASNKTLKTAYDKLLGEFRKLEAGIVGQKRERFVDSNQYAFEDLLKSLGLG